MVNPIKKFAEILVTNGYGSDIRTVPYGLTKQTTYEVFVEDAGWQSVNPFGDEEYCALQHRTIKRRNTLSILLTYLNEDQLLHFRKICQPINDMTSEQLVSAYGLVERTLVGNGYDADKLVEDLFDSISIDK